MILAWNKGILEIVRQSEKRPLILYGAGFWGEVSLRIFEKAGARVTAFADDDNMKWGTMCYGLPIYSLKQCKELYENAVYVICVDEGDPGKENQRKYWYAMRENLNALDLWDVNSEIHMYYYTFLLEVDPRMYMNSEVIRRNESNYNVQDIDKLIIFNHMGESGAIYFDQLLDGHPNIISIPGGVPIEAVYENRLKNLEGEELVIEIMAQMNWLFHGELEKISYTQRFIYGYVDSEGTPLSDKILICAEKYLLQLIGLFDGDFKLKSYGHLLKILSAAYANCIGKKKTSGQNNWFFYHMHAFAPDFDELSKKFIEDFNVVRQLYLIREPIRRLYSLLNRLLCLAKSNKDEFKKERLLQWLLAGTGCYLKLESGSDEDVRIIRFEDLKLANKRTMEMLCDWLEIPYDVCLEETTVNGIVAYFDHYDENGVKCFITGNDTSALQPRPMDNLFSNWDIVRLELVYSKFKHTYGYEVNVPFYDSFSDNTRKEIFQTDFRFASAIQKHMGMESYELEDEFHYNAGAVIRQTFETFMTENQGEFVLYPCISPKLER